MKETAIEEKTFVRHPNRWLFVIVLLGLLIRLPGFTWGVPKEGRPYGLNMDERTTLRALTNMQPSKMNFDLKYYDNPGFFYYQCGVAYAAASIVGYVRLTKDREFYRLNPNMDARFYYVGRFLALLYGVGTIIALYYAGRIVGDALVGLFAAGMATLAPTLIVNSRMMTTEACQIFWMTVALVFAFLAVKSPTRRNWILLGAAIGLSIASKVTSAVFLIWIPVVYFLRARKSNEQLFSNLRMPVFAILTMLFAFVLTNPYYLQNILNSWAATILTTDGPIRSHIYNAFYTPFITNAIGFGPLIMVATLPALIMALKRRDSVDWIVIAAFVPLLVVFMTYPNITMDRRLLPIVPLYLILVSRWIGSQCLKVGYLRIGLIVLFFMGSAAYTGMFVYRYILTSSAEIGSRWFSENIQPGWRIGVGPDYRFNRGPDDIGQDYLIATGDEYSGKLQKRTRYEITTGKTWNQVLEQNPEVLIDVGLDNDGSLMRNPSGYYLAATIDQPRPGFNWLSVSTNTEYLFFHYRTRVFVRSDLAPLYAQETNSM